MYSVILVHILLQWLYLSIISKVSFPASLCSISAEFMLLIFHSSKHLYVYNVVKTWQGRYKVDTILAIEIRVLPTWQ